MITPLAHEGHKKGGDSPPLAEVQAEAHEAPLEFAHPARREHPPSSSGDAHSPTSGELPALLAWLGKFDPPPTRFPIALFTVAALGEFLFARTGATSYRHAVLLCVRVGAATAILAPASGVLVLLEHAEARGASRRPFRLALFSTAALVGVTGFLGGALLYGLDHYAW